MSVVTNVILKLSELTNAGIDSLNEIWAKPNGQIYFMSCSDAALPDGWYAGDKRLEVDLYPGAFNHLDMDGLLAAVRSIAWEYPEYVQLFAQGEDEEQMCEVAIFPHPAARTGAPDEAPSLAETLYGAYRKAAGNFNHGAHLPETWDAVAAAAICYPLPPKGIPSGLTLATAEQAGREAYEEAVKEGGE